MKKKTKSEVAYQYQPKATQQCSKCVMWRAPDSCTDVAGPIKPYGWCRIFAVKKEAA